MRCSFEEKIPNSFSLLFIGSQISHIPPTFVIQIYLTDVLGFDQDNVTYVITGCLMTDLVAKRIYRH